MRSAENYKQEQDLHPLTNKQILIPHIVSILIWNVGVGG